METLLCQNETTQKQSKTSENPTGNVKNDFTTGTQKPNVRENVMPTIKSGKIYLITNLINDKKYVGITTQTLKQRWYGHINRKNDRRSILHNSIKKYGKENFKIELVEELHNVTEKGLLLKETFYIDKYNTFIDNGHGYNLIKENPQKLIYSDFTRNKMSKNRTGKRNSFYGKIHTDETKSQISKSRMGIGHTEETKKRISKSLTGDKSYRFNRRIRKFKNVRSQEEFVGVQYDFRKKYNLCHQGLTGLICGKRKSHKGWILVE